MVVSPLLMPTPGGDRGFSGFSLCCPCAWVKTLCGYLFGVWMDGWMMDGRIRWVGGWADGWKVERVDG